MYEILLHVSGIALLEISFFFYYIGPKETEMFMHYIKRILDSSLLDNGDGILDIRSPTETTILPLELIYSIQSLFLNQTSQTQEELYKDSMQAITDREAQNAELFQTSIMYWGSLAGFSILVYFIQNAYFSYRNSKGKKTGVVTVLSEQHIEDIEMVRYRKTSMDSEDADSRDITESIPSSNFRKICKIGTHYFMFSGCIVTFQYLFFKYIAFVYKPLSIEEIKYYLFTYFVARNGIEMPIK